MLVCGAGTWARGSWMCELKGGCGDRGGGARVPRMQMRALANVRQCCTQACPGRTGLRWLMPPGMRPPPAP